MISFDKYMTEAKHSFDKYSDLDKMQDKNLERLDDYVDDNNEEAVVKGAKIAAQKEVANSVGGKEIISKFYSSKDIDEKEQNAILRMFAEYDLLDLYKVLIENNGFLTQDDLKKNSEGNLIELIKDNAKTATDKYNSARKNEKEKVSYKEKDLDELIKEFINMSAKGSAASGKYELFLITMLDKGNKPKEGDVGIENETLEVKACKGKPKPSGAHPAGQKGDIKPSGEIYKKMIEVLDDKDITKEYGKEAFFQSNKAISSTFFKLCKSVDDNERVAKAVAAAICYQYESAKVNENDKAVKSFINILKDNIEGSDVSGVLNAVGALQLYCYAKIEKFDHFIILYFNDQNYNDTNNGDYYYVDDPELFADINNTIKHFTFWPLDNVKSTQGRTGKMFIKI